MANDFENGFDPTREKSSSVIPAGKARLGAIEGHGRRAARDSPGKRGSVDIRVTGKGARGRGDAARARPVGVGE